MMADNNNRDEDVVREKNQDKGVVALFSEEQLSAICDLIQETCHLTLPQR